MIQQRIRVAQELWLQHDFCRLLGWDALKPVMLQIAISSNSLPAAK